MHGFKYLRDRRKTKKLHAICLPGVGDSEIMNESQGLCEIHKSHIITTEKDLYDYLTTY
jgi:hypothetical protein